MTTLRGVYRDGAVYFHEPLELPDNTEVDVSLSPVNVQNSIQSERERIHAIFLAAGLVREWSHDEPKNPPLSPARAAELAEKLAQAGSLSELISKERDEHDDHLLDHLLS